MVRSVSRNVQDNSNWINSIIRSRAEQSSEAKEQACDVNEGYIRHSLMLVNNSEAS